MAFALHRVAGQVARRRNPRARAREDRVGRVAKVVDGCSRPHGVRRRGPPGGEASRARARTHGGKFRGGHVRYLAMLVWSTVMPRRSAYRRSPAQRVCAFEPDVQRVRSVAAGRAAAVGGAPASRTGRFVAEGGCASVQREQRRQRAAEAVAGEPHGGLGVDLAQVRVQRLRGTQRDQGARVGDQRPGPGLDDKNWWRLPGTRTLAKVK